MSNSRSGVKVSENLAHQVKQVSPTARFLIVQISHEEFVVKKSVDRAGSWTTDFNKISSNLEAKQPCFIIYWKDMASEKKQVAGIDKRLKLDSLPASEKCSKIILMLYNPDDSEVRPKMLYASSWSGLRELCGKGAEEYQANLISEFSYSAYSKSRESDDSLLSDVERSLRESESADLVNLEEAKQASGFNMIAAATGAKGLPKVVQDSIIKAQSQRNQRNGGKVYRAEPSSTKSDSAVPRLITAGAGSENDDSPKVSSARSISPEAGSSSSNVKPSKLKTWPPQQTA